jgi:hypothetical protein
MLPAAADKQIIHCQLRSSYEATTRNRFHGHERIAKLAAYIVISLYGCSSSEADRKAGQTTTPDLRSLDYFIAVSYEHE